MKDDGTNDPGMPGQYTTAFRLRPKGSTYNGVQVLNDSGDDRVELRITHGEAMTLKPLESVRLGAALIVAGVRGWHHGRK